METTVGIFASRDGAERARRALLAAGVRGEDMQISATLTADGIGAEAPGEDYENQNEIRESAPAKARARFTEDVLAGACALSVAAAGDLQGVERLLREQGARAVMRRP
jgi:hypothetical protein